MNDIHLHVDTDLHELDLLRRQTEDELRRIYAGGQTPVTASIVDAYDRRLSAIARAMDRLTRIRTAVKS